MRSFLTLTLGTYMAILGPPQDTGAESAKSAKVDTPAIIDVKRTASIEVVYLDHVGPYWSLYGPFRQVREYMLANEQLGPMFARFLDDPTGTASREIRSEVGFIVTGEHQPAPPFKKLQRDAELVAYMTVDATASPGRSYAVLHAWIDSQGYSAIGPITEIYAPLEPGKVRRQQTEIQMPIRSAEAAAPAGGEPQDAEVGPETAAAPEPSDRSEGPGILAETADQMDVPEISGGHAAAQSPPPAKPKHAFPHEKETVEVKRAPVLPVKDLIAAREFERLAEQLLPAPEAIPQEYRLWLGQLVFRISAAAKGIRHTHPDEGKDMIELGEMIARRYRTVSAGFQFDPLAQAVVTVDAHGDPNAARRGAIMRDMDALLGRIALKVVSADEAETQLGEILQRVQDLLATSGGPSD